MTEFSKYEGFLTKAIMDRGINTLSGILKGISIDQKINDTEKEFLNIWVQENQNLATRHPFSELLGAVENIIATEKILENQKYDINWLCDNIIENKFYDEVTTGIQELHGILGGIVSDGIVNKEELIGLREWQNSREYLRGIWPFEEVSAIITHVLSDGIISEEEHSYLVSFFGQFVSILDDRTINPKLISTPISKRGICAVDPVIDFSGNLFCATGAMSKYSRVEFKKEIERLGGEFIDRINKRVNYLIVGAEGNECWAYSCYGRKIEETIKLRQNGNKIWIVHELDFHDAVQDA